MDLVQYDSKNRRVLKLHGQDPKAALHDTFKFFNEDVDQMKAVWNTIRDPLTNEVHENTSSFRVINEHSGLPLFTIQLEF